MSWLSQSGIHVHICEPWGKRQELRRKAETAICIRNHVRELDDATNEIEENIRRAQYSRNGNWRTIPWLHQPIVDDNTTILGEALCQGVRERDYFTEVQYAS